MWQTEGEGNDGRLSVQGSALAVALLVFLVYCPVLRNGFVGWDDGIYVYQNPRLRDLTLPNLLGMFTSIHASGNWHPLTELSHAADCALWGMNPKGHHLTSILLHGLNAGLVVALTFALARARSAERHARTMVAAVATGLLWGLHPLRVESAAWVSERKDVLCASFYLAGLLYYLRYAQEIGGAPARKKRFYLGALACFLLALLSKPMAVSLPFVLLILDAYPLARLGRVRLGRLLVEKLPFLALAAASAVITLKAQRAGGAFRAMLGVPLGTKVLVATRATVSYLGKTLWPSKLLPLYSYPQNVSWASWRFGVVGAAKPGPTGHASVLPARASARHRHRANRPPIYGGSLHLLARHRAFHLGRRWLRQAVGESRDPALALAKRGGGACHGAGPGGLGFPDHAADGGVARQRNPVDPGDPL